MQVGNAEKQYTTIPSGQVSNIGHEDVQPASTINITGASMSGKGLPNLKAFAGAGMSQRRDSNKKPSCSPGLLLTFMKTSSFPNKLLQPPKQATVHAGSLALRVLGTYAASVIYLLYFILSFAASPFHSLQDHRMPWGRRRRASLLINTNQRA